jgi:hypothetical protein
VEQLTPIMKERGEKLTALRLDKSISAAARKTKSQEIRDAADAKIKPLLKGEQPDQWQKLKEDWGKQYREPKETPKPVDKPKPTRKAMQQDFNDLLNKLTTQDKPVKTAKTGPRAIQGVGAGNQMTADLADALKSQIYRCWSKPEGYAADRANDLVVEFDLELGPDGRVIRADSMSVNPGNPSRYNYAAGIAARNAIYQCQPYRLPAERYPQWRQINPMRFDPRQNP